MDYLKELQVILETDPLGLLDVKPRTSAALTSDSRLIASFEEINNFIRQHDREPCTSTDMCERQLYSRLKAIRENPEMATALLKSDTFGLLANVEIPQPTPMNTIEDILSGDALGLLGDSTSDASDPTDIFTLKNVPARSKMPDYIAKRKVCREFEKFEHLFKKNHADLAIRAKVTRPFNSEMQIVPDTYFILQGTMVYVAAVGKHEKKNFGNVNARLYCVFENGTESNLLKRSLAAALWKDECSRQIVDPNQCEMFQETRGVDHNGKPTGYIYILRSLSKDPKITQIKDLHKVGFSRTSVTQRVHASSQDPTYLFADVLSLAEYETYDLDPQKLELLLHKFFAEVCLNLDVFDAEGKRYMPREWFVAPVHVIHQAIQYVISGEITLLTYDTHTQEIVKEKGDGAQEQVARTRQR